MEATLAFLFGLLIGSFLNVCIYRLPRDLSVVRPRSFCPFCEKQLSWYDNLPVLSFVLLKGRCRFCGAGIPVRYPLVEVLTGVAFALAVQFFGLTWQSAKLCLFAAICIELTFSDLEERILPDEFTLGGTAVGLGLAWFVPLQAGLSYLIVRNPEKVQLMSLVESGLGAALCGGLLWSVGSIYEKFRGREGLGFGDVKMVMMIGAFLGLSGALVTLIVASVLGGIGGLVYIYATGKNASTYELPFGSFLGLAALAVAAFGEWMTRFYLQMGN
jgi:leader peptidase (prepilin peptidase)/N-methyltransferase